jgi:hypothetical protein
VSTSRTTNVTVMYNHGETRPFVVQSVECRVFQLNKNSRFPEEELVGTMQSRMWQIQTPGSSLSENLRWAKAQSFREEMYASKLCWIPIGLRNREKKKNTA